MHLVLTAFGTRGDVQPLMALARGLCERGHRATLVAPPDFADEARIFGISFIPMGLEVRSMLERHRDHLGSNPFKMLRAVRGDAARDVGHQFDAVRQAARGADAIIGAGIMWAAVSVAEAYRIPYWYLAYAPEALASDHHPPVFVPYGGLPRWANRFGWKLFGTLVEWIVRGPINRQRASLDLAPVEAAIPLTFAQERALLATDAELAEWPPDVVRAAPPTGWLSLPDHRELDANVQRFLDAGSPPIYFGFGSMVDSTPARTARTLADAARAVGRRALISAGWADLGAHESLGPDVLVIGSVPHAKLFPRVGAIVHHGGAGTTHAAARAGVPQIIVPHLLDQFSWARRVARLRLGPLPLPRSKLSAARLATRLERCFADGEFPQRATEMATRIADRDGVANLIGWIERELGCTRPSRPSPPTPSRRAPAAPTVPSSR